MLPFGFRPELAPPGPSAPWTPIVILGAVALLGIWLWWRQQQVDQPSPLAAEPHDPWGELEATLGAPDWYDRLAKALTETASSAAHAAAGVGHLLQQAGERDPSGRWRRLQRHWEWATYGGFPGTAAQHREDLATAREGLPNNGGQS